MARSFPITLVFLVAALLAGGCNFGAMHPGESCARCHNGDEAPRFSVAGTVYASGAADDGDGIAGVTIEITDSKGESLSLTSNEAGNFYTERALTPPLLVNLLRAGTAGVTSNATSGDCNSCHAAGSSIGRIHFP